MDFGDFFVRVTSKMIRFGGNFDHMTVGLWLQPSLRCLNDFD